MVYYVCTHAQPQALPDFVGQKQQLFGGDVCAASAPATTTSSVAVTAAASAAAAAASGATVRIRKGPKVQEPSKRLFVGNLPLLVAAADIRKVLASAQGGGEGGVGVESDAIALDWLTDRETGAFYGSVFVKMSSLDAAQRLVAAARRDKGVRIAGVGACKRPRLLRIQFAPYDGKWPAKVFFFFVALCIPQNRKWGDGKNCVMKVRLLFESDTCAHTMYTHRATLKRIFLP